MYSRVVDVTLTIGIDPGADGALVAAVDGQPIVLDAVAARAMVERMPGLLAAEVGGLGAASIARVGRRSGRLTASESSTIVHAIRRAAWPAPPIANRTRAMGAWLLRQIAHLGGGEYDAPALVVVEGTFRPAALVRDEGAWQGWVTALGWPLRVVPAATWQADMLPPGPRGSTKARSIEATRVAWPAFDLRRSPRGGDHAGYADAAHLARWGYAVLTGADRWRVEHSKPRSAGCRVVAVGHEARMRAEYARGKSRGVWALINPKGEAVDSVMR